MIAALAPGPDGLRLNNRTTAECDDVPVTGAAYPARSSDGRSIYFLPENQDAGIYRIDASDGQVERSTDLKGFRPTGVTDLWIDLDPSDMPILLRDLNTDDIYALALEEN